MGGPNLQSHVNFWLRGHMTNEKNLYLHLHSTYGRLIWKSGNLHCRNPIHQSFDIVVTWKMKNLITASPWYLESPNLTEYQLKVGGPNEVMWSFYHVVRWKIRKSLSAFQQHLLQLNLSEQRLRVGDTISQVTWIFNQVVTWSLFVKCF